MHGGGTTHCVATVGTSDGRCACPACAGARRSPRNAGHRPTGGYADYSGRTGDHRRSRCSDCLWRSGSGGRVRCGCRCGGASGRGSSDCAGCGRRCAAGTGRCGRCCGQHFDCGCCCGRKDTRPWLVYVAGCAQSRYRFCLNWMRPTIRRIRSWHVALKRDRKSVV